MNLRKRKIFKTGTSKTITLPPEWLRGHENPDSVEIWYDGIMVILTTEEERNLPEETRRQLQEILHKR